MITIFLLIFYNIIFIILFRLAMYLMRLCGHRTLEHLPWPLLKFTAHICFQVI